MVSDNKSKLFDVVVRLDDGGLIFDEILLGRMKGLVFQVHCDLYLVFSNPAYSEYFFGFQVKFE